MEKEISRGYLAGPELAGQRLDAALAAFFPEMGLRGRRRLLLAHIALVDGIPRSPAFRLRGNEAICLVPRIDAGAEHKSLAACAADTPRLLARRGQLFFLYKPAGLHSEHLAGGAQDSLERLLDQFAPHAQSRLRMLTRLDMGTSGIVLAAGDADAARLWRTLENAGKIRKYYLALLEGNMESEHVARNAINSGKARRTRALDADGPQLRHTRFSPLACFQASCAPWLAPGCPENAFFTLALCQIAKGARHQIRVHAARAGHALAGDRLYGAEHGEIFFLHHFGIQWPEGRASCPPPWLARLPAPLRERLATFSCAWNENGAA